MKLWNLLLLYSCVHLISGCTLNRPYRTYAKDPPVVAVGAKDIDSDGERNRYLITTSGSYDLGFVEFDDQGWFWSYQAWDRVKAAIVSEQTAHKDGGLSIIVFIHGWKNNAKYDNTNLMEFNAFLKQLSTEMQTAEPKRKVFGLYVGWRGLSVKHDWFPPFGEELSFYNRKAVAERIGHQGAATQVFAELQSIQDRFNQHTANPKRARTELVFIGHSFGGQLLFSAVSQILTERLVEAEHYGEGAQQSRRNSNIVRSLGDLVILLNPAFEASLYNNLIALASSSEITYPTNQPPVLLTLTSQSDWATGTAFPAGRWVSTRFEKDRASKGPGETNLYEGFRKNETPWESDAILETVGHDHEYINWELAYTNLSPTNSRLFTLMQPSLVALANPVDVLATNNVTTNMADLKPYIFPNHIGTNNYACILKPVTKNGYHFTMSKPGNPFFNVTVEPKIMDGHNDITNVYLTRFIKDFILFTRKNYMNVYTNSLTIDSSKANAANPTE